MIQDAKSSDTDAKQIGTSFSERLTTSFVSSFKHGTCDNEETTAQKCVFSNSQQDHQGEDKNMKGPSTISIDSASCYAGGRRRNERV